MSILTALTIGVTAAIGCSSSDTKTGPSTTKCQVALTLKQAAIEANGGTGAVTVSTQPECAWTAASDATWITGVTPTSGQGNGEVQFQVAANPGSAPRDGGLVLNGVRAQLTQAGATCDVVISPAGQDISAGGGSGSVSIASPTGCAWTASSNSPWLSIMSGASGSGSGSVVFSVASNTGAARSGAIAVGARSFGISQASGIPACQTTIQPTVVSIGAAGGTAPVTVQVDAGCPWTSTSNASWVTFSGASAGSGGGSVTLSAPANTGNSRTGAVTVAGQTVTVTQAGSCAVGINPPAQTVASAGGNGAAIAVTAAPGCGWTSVSSDGWITITAGASGSGNGTVNFTTSSNPGPARTAIIAIGGQIHTVTQGTGCTVSINPIAQTVAPAGGNATAVAVTAAGGCGWTSSSSVSWITITSGASGSGSGTVNFTVAANTGPARTGIVTIGGQVHTVTQTSGCTVGINPTSQTVGAGGGNATAIAVTAASGCGWTSVASAPWLTITSGASGTGNGTVNFSVGANTGPARTGTITIGGQDHTVTQASGCTYGLGSTSLSIGRNGGNNRTVSVTTTSACAWTATSNVPWITISSGASGTGNGTVTFDIAANNTGVDRVGTLTIAGITFTVNQAH